MTDAPKPTVIAPANPRPKVRFQWSQDNVSKHRHLMESTDLQRGLDFALLEYQGQIANETTTDQGAAFAAAFKLKGALEFLNVLKYLAEPPIVLPNRVSENLDHRA